MQEAQLVTALRRLKWLINLFLILFLNQNNESNLLYHLSPRTVLAVLFPCSHWQYLRGVFAVRSSLGILLAIAFEIGPFRFSEATIKYCKVSTYSRLGSNNGSSMTAAGLGEKSGRSSHIECIVVFGKSL
jgi:hypothetical protein